MVCNTPSVSVNEYLNWWLLSTDVTLNVPLNPLLDSAVVLTVSLMFLTIILSPTLTPCGNSLKSVAVPEAAVHVLMKLRFLL